MRVLELNQQEFRNVKRAHIIDILGDTSEETVLLHVTEEEYKKIKSIIFVKDESKEIQIPQYQYRQIKEANIFHIQGDSKEDIVSLHLNKDEWRLYHKFKLHQQREQRRKRKLFKERDDNNKIKNKIAVSCKNCGKVVLSYPDLKHHICR